MLRNEYNPCGQNGAPPPDMSFRGSESESRNLTKLQILSCVGFFSNVVDSSTPLRSGRNDKPEGGFIYPHRL